MWVSQSITMHERAPGTQNKEPLVSWNSLRVKKTALKHMAQHINTTRGDIRTKQAQRAELSYMVEREKWGSLIFPEVLGRRMLNLSCIWLLMIATEIKNIATLIFQQ